MSSLVGNQEEARLVHFENRLPDVFGPDYLGFTPLKDTVDPDRPVTSLDQLYVQASSLHPLLQHFVIKWASGSNGMFAYKSRAEGASSENSYENTSTVICLSSTALHHEFCCTAFVVLPPFSLTQVCQHI